MRKNHLGEIEIPMQDPNDPSKTINTKQLIPSTVNLPETLLCALVTQSSKLHDDSMTMDKLKEDTSFMLIYNLYNEVFFTIDKDGDYSISIESAEINNLIATHTDILELLLDLTNNRNYTFLRALLPEEHAIIIDNKPIITCIRSNRDTDKMYYKLKRDKTRYVYEDTKYDAVVCLDLKAAHVSDGFLLR